MDKDETLSGSPPLVDRVCKEKLGELDAILQLLLSGEKLERTRGQHRWDLMCEKNGGMVALAVYVCRRSGGSNGCFRDRLKLKGGLYEGALDKCQMGAVLLRRGVEERWISLSLEEQDEIRELLLCCYVWLPVRIRSLILESIRVIAECGGEWKALLSTILYDLTQAYENNVESGMVAALELLYMLSDGQIGSGLLEAVQDTVIHLARGMRRFKFTSQRCEITLTSRCRRLCLRIYRCALDRGLYSDRLESWKEILDGILDELALSPTDLDCIKSALEVLKCYEYNLSTGLVDKVLNILRGYYGFFESMVIKDDKDFGGVIDEDADGGPTEFIICFVRICSKLLGEALEDKLLNILCVVSLFVQVPEAQSLIWESDPAVYLEESRNSFTLRGVVGEFVSKSLRVIGGQAAINSIVEAAAQLIKVSEQKKIGGEKCWWKLLEVSLWLIENVIKRNRFIYKLDDHILQNLMSTLGSILTFKTHDLLQGRALLTVGRMGRFLQGKHPADVLTMVRISTDRLSQPDSKPYLQIAACKAINAFLPLLQSRDREGLGPILESILRFITKYMFYNQIFRLGLKTAVTYLKFARTDASAVTVRAITELSYNISVTTNDPDIQKLFLTLLSLNQHIQDHLVKTKLLTCTDISSNLIYANVILKTRVLMDPLTWRLCCKILSRVKRIATSTQSVDTEVLKSTEAKSVDLLGSCSCDVDSPLVSRFKYSGGFYKSSSIVSSHEDSEYSGRACDTKKLREESINSETSNESKNQTPLCESGALDPYSGEKMGAAAKAASMNVDEDQLGTHTESVIWILRKGEEFLQSPHFYTIGSYLIFLLQNKYQVHTASLLQNLLVHYPAELDTPWIQQIFVASCLHGFNADTHIVIALGRIICIDSRDFVGLLVDSQISLEEGRFTAFALFVTLMCTCCRNPVLATHDRHVLIVTALKLLMHESNRLCNLPTAQDVPYLLLKFLITSYFVLTSPPQSDTSDSSTNEEVSTSDSGEDSTFHDEQQSLWEYDQLSDTLLKSPCARLTNALVNQLPSILPKTFESLEPQLRDKLELINKSSYDATFD